MSEPDAPADDLPAVLAAFELRLQQDRDAGRELPLSAYQALYPGYARAIARALARAQRGAPAEEFSALYRADLARGQVAPLRGYLDRFPGREAEVARRFADLEAARAADEARADLPAGGRLGPYRLEREVGRGGQGVVYLAHDQRLNRDVAIKVLSQLASCSPATLRRFEREAEVASKLDHPGICPIYDVGRAGGAPFLVMRHVAGETLAHKLARAKASGSGVLAPARSDDVPLLLALCEAAARALHVAHEAGIVHRDVKPGNLMVTPNGAPVLLDFGLAQLQDGDASTLTMSHDRLGTPAYMAPEQLVAGGKVDRRTDVHALGVALYECLTLRRPFEAPTVEGVFSAILAGSYVAPRQHRRDLSRDLDTVVRTALEPDLVRRYQSAADLADDLARLGRGEPVLARRPSALRRLSRFTRRNPGIVATLAALFVALLSIVTWTEHKNRQLDAALGEARALADAKLLDRYGNAPLHLPRGEVADLAGLDAWLAQVDALASRMPRHRERLIRQQAAGDAVEVADLQQLLERFAQFAAEDGTVARIKRRRAMLVGAQALAQGDHAALWAQAAAALARDSRFAGYSLRPQPGLIPLGSDPLSGLQEFAALDTGELPSRGADGTLVRSERCAVVFVLLPGSEFVMGCADDDPSGQPGARPRHRLRATPFLLAKYELTQAQYQHIVGDNPADLRAGVVAGGVKISFAHPIDSVSYVRCQELARVSGWLIPTEAQWEFAARGGSVTRWSTGDERDSLRGFVNLYDESLLQRNPIPGIDPWPGFDDGYPLHAPVGSFRANPFGLHDVHGNVSEWCRERVIDYREQTQGEDLERVGQAGRDSRIIRGGSFMTEAAGCRSDWRDSLGRESHAASVGFRPARRMVR